MLDMAADAISVYLDTSTPLGAIYKDALRAPLNFGSVYQGATLSLRVYPCVATSNTVSSPYISKLPLDTLDLQVVVGPAAGAEAIKAAQYTWQKQLTPDSDGESGYFYADLNLNTSEMATAIGSSETYSTKIAFLLSRNGGPYSCVHQTSITLLAVVKDPDSEITIPTPTQYYLTVAQAEAKFVMWDNRILPQNAGRTLILVSPDSSHISETGVDNDGNPIENLA